MSVSGWHWLLPDLGLFAWRAPLRNRSVTMTPCWEGPQRKIVRTLSWKVWWVLHVTFLKCDCPSTPSHLLVSQVLSPGPRPVLTLGFAGASDPLDCKASLSSLGLCLFVGWATAGVQTSHSHLDLYENASYATQLDISPHRDFCQNSPINGLPAGLRQTELTGLKHSISSESSLVTLWVGPRQEVGPTSNSLNPSSTC